MLIFPLVVARQPLVFAFSCCEFSLRFANVTTLAAVSARNVVNGITNFFFIHLVFRFWKHLAYCPIGFECHFDAVVFQNPLYWLRGPANVWNCAVPLFGFYNGGLGLLACKMKRGLGLLACKMKRGKTGSCSPSVTLYKIFFTMYFSV